MSFCDGRTENKMKESEELDKKIKKILLEIKQEWELTNDILDDFIKVTIQVFKRKNNYENNIDKQILFKFSKELITKFYGGFCYTLGKFGEDNLYTVMKLWIAKDINDEIIRCLKNHNKKQTDISSGSQNISIEGGLMYA